VNVGASVPFYAFNRQINLDIEVESRDLTSFERNELSQASDQSAKLLREEEKKYYQRAKATDVLLGDNNTKYF
jgi:hypothetical protein